MAALGNPAIQPDDDHRGGRSEGEVSPAAAAPGVTDDLLLGLTHGLSHETRNSLNALAIHLEILADKVRDPARGTIPAHLEKNLVASRTQIRRLSEIVGRFTEVVLGVPETRDLSGYVETARSLSSYQLRRSDTEVAMDIPAGIRVEIDASAMLAFLVDLFLLLAEGAPGARFSCSTSIEGEWVRLRFKEDAPGGGWSPRSWARLERLQALVLDAGGRMRFDPEGGRAWTIGLPLRERPEARAD